MAQKTYVPQFIRELRKLNVYVDKHGPTMSTVLSSAQQAALTDVQQATSLFLGAVINEAP